MLAFCLHLVVAGLELDRLAALEPRGELGPEVAGDEQPAVSDDAFALQPRGDLVRPSPLGIDHHLAALAAAPARRPGCRTGRRAPPTSQHQQQDEASAGRSRKRRSGLDLRGSRSTPACGAGVPADASAPAARPGCAPSSRGAADMRVQVAGSPAGGCSSLRSSQCRSHVLRAARPPTRCTQLVNVAKGEARAVVVDPAHDTLSSGYVIGLADPHGLSAEIRPDSYAARSTAASPASSQARLRRAAAQDQRGVGAAEAEGVRQHRVDRRASCALCGTRSMAVSTEGLSRLSVGGAMLSRMASTEKIASTAPAAPSRCPTADLVDDMASLPAALPNRRSTAAELDLVAHRVEVPCALT